MRRNLEDTIKFLDEVWHLNTTHIAYYLNGWDAREGEEATKRTRKSVFLNPETMIDEQLSLIKIRTAYPDDCVPFLYPYLGVGVYASAFGCEIIFPENQDPWTKPLLRLENIEDVYSLETPNPQDGLLGKVLEYVNYFQKERGEYPIRLTDTQSPIDSASLIMKYEEFLLAMYTNPKEVHHLLKMVTELIIKFAKLEKSIAKGFTPNHSPQIYQPADWGICLSDDLIAVLSPELYKEFALPYVNILSEEFNGVFLHSCGDFSHNLENLSKIKNLRGIDFGVTEMPIENMVEKLADKTLFVCHLGLNTKLHFNDTFEYLDYIFQRRKPDTHLFILIPIFSTKGEKIPLDKVNKILEDK